jgi:hypothetical protein
MATKGLPGTEIVVSENDSNDGTVDMVGDYCDRVEIVSLPFYHGGELEFFRR